MGPETTVNRCLCRDSLCNAAPPSLAMADAPLNAENGVHPVLTIAALALRVAAGVVVATL